LAEMTFPRLKLDPIGAIAPANALGRQDRRLASPTLLRYAPK
jgi:hypothetical protein